MENLRAFSNNFKNLSRGNIDKILAIKYNIVNNCFFSYIFFCNIALRERERERQEAHRKTHAQYGDIKGMLYLYYFNLFFAFHYRS